MMARKTVLSLANMVLGAALGLIAAKLVSYYLAREDVGEVAYALALLGLLFFVTDLGMGQAHVKRVSEGRHAGDCFATYATFKLAATGVFLALALGSYWIYAVALGKPFESTTPLVLAIGLIFYMAKAVQDIGQSSFDARVETAKSQLALLLDTLARVGLTAIVCFVAAGVLSNAGPLAGRLDPEDPIVGWIAREPAAALAAATTAGAVAAATAATIMLLRIQERGRFRMELLRDYARFALPLFLTSATAMIAVNVDAAALGFFGGADDAGLFAQIRRIPVVLQSVGAGLAVLLFPTISAMASRKDAEGIRRSMDTSLRFLSMLLVPVCAFVIVFAEPVISILLSDQYVEGANALRIMCVYVLLVSLGYAHSTLLLGLDHPRIAARIGLANALAVIVLDLILVPDDIRSLGIPLAGLGVEGAALATLGSGLVWYFGLRYATRRVAGYHEPGRLALHLVAGAAMAAAMVAVHLYAVELTRVYHLPLFLAVGGVAYMAALVALREFTREDVAFVRAAVHPIEMLRYVRDEVFHRRR